MPDLVENVLRNRYAGAFKFGENQRGRVIAEYHQVKSLSQAMQIKSALDCNEPGIDLENLQQVNDPQLADNFFRCGNDLAFAQGIEDHDIALWIFAEMQECLQR